MVAIRSALLVPAPQAMKDLVYDDALVLTAPANGDALVPTNTSNIGMAPMIILCMCVCVCVCVCVCGAVKNNRVVI